MNSFKSRYNKRRNFNKRRYKRKNNLNILRSKPYTIRQGIVKLGPGSTLSRVTLRYTYEAQEAGSAVVNVIQNMVNNVEFERNLTIFHYWKLIGIKLLLQPRINEYNSNDPTGRITMDWDNDLLETVVGDDSAKEIAAYSTRYQVYRFAPPNAMLTSSNGRRFNFTQWISTSDDLQNAIPPGYLKISCDWNFSFVIEAIVIWKGNATNIAVSNRVIIKAKKMEKMKDEDEEEKKEKDKDTEDEINEQVKKIDKIKIDDEENKEDEEDVWNRDPLLDRKPRWKNKEKKFVKEMVALEKEIKRK